MASGCRLEQVIQHRLPKGNKSAGRFRAWRRFPAEGDLRRIIGDGGPVPDGEVKGLTDHDLIELYRGMVLLRTYDERSVVYQRQGRIGTYATASSGDGPVAADSSRGALLQADRG